MADARITYTDEGTETLFVWHGGAYIDVTSTSAPEAAFDVINVWHDQMDRSHFEQEAIGTPRPFRAILEAFEARCEQYLAEMGAEEA